MLPWQPAAIFAAGRQAHVPLLLGSNSAESSWRRILGEKAATPENYRSAMLGLFGDRADDALRLYPGSTSEEVTRSATELASDQFIAYSTWKWFDLHSSDRSESRLLLLLCPASTCARQK